MATTVADILGESGFTIDAPSGSVSSGGASATDGDGNGVRGTQDDTRPDNGGDGSNAGGYTTANPAAAAAPAADDRNDGGRPRGRTRRRDAADPGPARTRAAREEEVPINLDELLVTAHKILARVIEAPEFEITKGEAHLLSVAGKRVAKFIVKKALSPQQEAVGTFFLALLAIYGPRYFVYLARTGGPIVDAGKRPVTATKQPNGAASGVHSVSVAFGNA